MRFWISSAGEEIVYEADFAACCRRTARVCERSFECPSCGTRWQAPLPMESQDDAFMEMSLPERRRAA